MNPAIVVNCVTHFKGCDCREEKIKELFLEVIELHRSPSSAEYNECENIECMWCVEAKKIINI